MGNKVKVTSLKDFPYAGKMRKAGTVYEVESSHLGFLERTKLAEKYVSARTYKRRDMTAEKPETPADETIRTGDHASDEEETTSAGE